MFVPLASVILAGVVSLLFAAGVDSTLARITRSSLQNIANTVCHSLAYEAVSPDIVAPAFRIGMQAHEADLQFGKFSDVTLIMALPNESTLQSVDLSKICSNEDVTSLDDPDDPIAASAGGAQSPPFGNFEDFRLPKCTFQGDPDLDCILWAYPNLQLPAGIPVAFKEALIPGRGLGCSLSAEVQRYSFGEPITVSAQAIYSSLHIDDRSPNSPRAPLGLRIAISTQLTTPSLELGSPTDDFDVETFPLTFGAMVREIGSSSALDPWIVNYDPFCAPPPDDASPWCKTYRNATTPPSIETSHLRAFTAPRPKDPLSSDAFSRGGPALSETQRQELLIGCMNPPVLIRNIISSTLVSLAARDSVLRRHTEIVHINPMDILVQQDTSKSWLADNRPSTVLVPMGTDITRREFQIPFVEFRQDPVFKEGNLVRLGIGPIDTKKNRSAGEIFPFYETSPSEPHQLYTQGNQLAHSELSNQLRRCLHLYVGANDGAPTQTKDRRGIGALFDSRLSPSPYGLLSALDNGAFSFDPVLYHGSGDTENSGRYRGLPGAETGRILEEIDPEHSAVSGPLAQAQGPEEAWNPVPPSEMNSRRLNAVELVSVLGSSQRCPYTSISNPGGASLCPPEESRSATEYSKELLYFYNLHDLKPDYASLLLAITPPLSTDRASINPLSPAASPQPAFGHTPLTASNVRCNDAALVVITHQFSVAGSPDSVFSNTDSGESLFSRFRSDPDKSGTPLTIALVPTRSSSPEIEKLREYIFHGGLEDDPMVNVLVFAPAGCLDKSSLTTCTDSDYHKYWGEILDPDSPNYLPTFIRRFFIQRLSRQEAKRVL